MLNYNLTYRHALVIAFHKLPITKRCGAAPQKNIFVVLDRGKSIVLNKFNSLDSNTKDLVTDLICKIAINKNYRSPKIKYTLHDYNFGEIKPIPHRFFFFQKGEDSIVFFDYVMKKTDSLHNDVYKKINKKKEKYETEFIKYIKRNR